MSDDPKITPVEHGPLLVENPPGLTGSVKIDTAQQSKIALCRCGGV